jgi:hypothetical protein
VNGTGAHRILIRAGNILAGVIVLAVGYFVVATALGLRQVRNCADLQTLTFTIEAFREKTGRYPGSIAEAVTASGMNPGNKKYYSWGHDAWGHAYLYVQRNDGFILVSYGRGGEPDGIDYWHQTIQEGGQACRRLSADIFANRSGVVRCCGK